MTRWQRPSLTPVPLRQAVADRVRRIDPRRAARLLLVAMLAALLAQLGWQWRSTTAELGQRRAVVVVNRPIRTGEAISTADIDIEAWPVGLTPDDAIDVLPVDAIAAVDLVAGEVLIGRRILPTPDGLDASQRLVTIDQPLAPPPVVPGSRVELFGILPIGDGLTSPATRLAEGTVIVVSDTAISIAVDISAVPTIVEHTAFGSVDVVISP